MGTDLIETSLAVLVGANCENFPNEKTLVSGAGSSGVVDVPLVDGCDLNRCLGKGFDDRLLGPLGRLNLDEDIHRIWVLLYWFMNS